MLNKSGVTVSKSTQRRHLYKIAGDHEYYLNRFIDEARHMETILSKRFSDRSAIPPHHNLVNPDGISQDMLSKFSAEMMPSL